MLYSTVWILTHNMYHTRDHSETAASLAGGVRHTAEEVRLRRDRSMLGKISRRSGVCTLTLKNLSTCADDT